MSSRRKMTTFLVLPLFGVVFWFCIACEPILDESAYNAYVMATTPVATPTFTPGTGTYDIAQSVSISTTTSGASIRYTTDGTRPTETVGTLYSVPISVTINQTIKAIAYASGSPNSALATAVYTILGVATPTFSPPAGIYATAQSVTISTDTAGATIRYTTDGSIPSETVGTVYSVPIDVTANYTIKAIAYKSGLPASPVGSAAYAITYWATFGTVGSGANQFHNADGIALDASGRIYVADTDNHRIVRIDDISGTGWTTFGTNGSGTNQFREPTGVAVDASGHIYIADYGNHRIVYITDMDGTGWTTLDTNSSYIRPADIDFGVGGHIYIINGDYDTRIVRIDDISGTGLTAFGSWGSGDNHFMSPTGVAVDASGHIYIADMQNNRIVRMDNMSGVGWTALGGTYGSAGSGINEFNSPGGIAVDAGGRVYVADTGNHRIVRIEDMSGTGWTIFGSMGNGPNQFTAPRGIALGASGKCYVVNQGNGQIDRFVMP